jgi:glycerophosphoryl diester phosphodiesterase
VTAAHARGLKVWVYTVDDPAVAHELFALGIDGIITNQTALMWKTLATFAAPIAAQRP